VDYKEVLDGEQFAVFARLRDLRKRSGESQRDYVMQPKVGTRHESLTLGKCPPDDLQPQGGCVREVGWLS
jgi:hypothetical protein